MPFFGEELSDGEVFSLPIPSDYQLEITGVCLDLTNKVNKPVSFCVKTANSDTLKTICVLNSSSHRYHAKVSLLFAAEDEPVEFTAVGGALHVTGKWSWNEDDCDHDHNHDESLDEESDEESDEEDSVNDSKSEEGDLSAGRPASADREEDVKELPVQTDKKRKVEPTPEAPNAKKTKKVTIVVPDLDNGELESESSNGGKSAAPRPATPAKKKSPASTESTASNEVQLSTLDKNTFANTFVNKLKPWIVFPHDEDGEPVEEPRAVIKKNGLIITDYIIGKGQLPKPQSTVEILYEGMFPETGYTFDHNIRRHRPFIFRKGEDMVIKGMELGIEGMRVGGAREVIIPPELGYGDKGIGSLIKGNQTLVFRIQLIKTSNANIHLKKKHLGYSLKAL